MYECIKDKLREKGHNLEEGLNLFEAQLKEIGYLSDSNSLYLLFKKQAKCESPLMIKNYIDDIDVRINHFFEVQNSCYIDSNSEKENSKYFKVIEKLKAAGQVKNPWKLWETIHSEIDEQDYDHPFYRMNALVTLHSWSLDMFHEYGLENGCF